MPLTGRPGQPLLPYHRITVLLPPDADPAEVTVSLDNVVEQRVGGTCYVTPAVPPVSRDDVIEWPSDVMIIDGEDVAIYQNDALFPSSMVSTVKPGMLRQYRLLEVTLFPVRYNPVQGTLTRLVCATLQINGISQPLMPAPLAKSAAQRDLLPSDGEVRVLQTVKSMVANAALLSQYDNTPAPAPQGMAKTALSSRAQRSECYVIVTTSDIVSRSRMLETFIASKKMRGFSVRVLTEQDWQGKRGDQAADAIRGWLKANYQAINIGYALFIGSPDTDSSYVPMKLTWPRSWAQKEQTAETDFYYAELSGNWDADNDGLFGEDADDYYNAENGADKYAEIAVGRIPVYGTDLRALDRILAKSVTFENAQAEEIAWRKNALLSMNPSDASTLGYQLGEAIRNDFCLAAGWGSHRLYDDVNEFNNQPIERIAALETPPESVPCSEENVVQAWRSGRFGLSLWWTHGWPQGAADIFSSGKCDLLDDGSPAFTFQACCNNAQPDQADNIAYSLLKNGAIATVAATRISWYWIGENYFTNRTTASNAGMAYQFARCLIRDSLSVGDALNTVRAGIEPYGMWMNWLVFNVYGDPSLGITTASRHERLYEFAVNCGGPGYAAADGTWFHADTGFSGGRVAVVEDAIKGSEDDVLYQSERYDACSYAVALKPGLYQLDLYLAETFWYRTGKRIFGLEVEGASVIANLDILGIAGRCAAYNRRIVVQVSDGELNLRLPSARCDYPKLSAFSIRHLLPLVNTVPVAEAGIDRQHLPGEVVVLDGNRSYDPDDAPNPLTYRWKQVDGPSITLTGAQMSVAGFTPHTCGIYTFELTVSDGASVSAADRISITVSPISTSLVDNGDFGISSQGWEAQNANLTVAGINRQLFIRPLRDCPAGSVATVRQAGLSLVQGHRYRFSFMASTLEGSTVMQAAVTGNDMAGHGGYAGQVVQYPVSELPVGFSTVFTMQEPTDSDAQIRFTVPCGTTILVDNISLVDESRIYGEDLVTNGDFSAGMQEWRVWTAKEANAMHAFVNGCYRAQINAGGTQRTDVAVWHGGIDLQRTTRYRVLFTARSSANAQVRVALQGQGDITDIYSAPWTVATGDIWRQYETELVMTGADNPDARLQFSMGGANAGIVEIDDVMILPVMDDF